MNNNTTSTPKSIKCEPPETTTSCDPWENPTAKQQVGSPHAQQHKTKKPKTLARSIKKKGKKVIRNIKAAFVTPRMVKLDKAAPEEPDVVEQETIERGMADRVEQALEQPVDERKVEDPVDDIIGLTVLVVAEERVESQGEPVADTNNFVGTVYSTDEDPVEEEVESLEEDTTESFVENDAQQLFDADEGYSASDGEDVGPPPVFSPIDFSGRITHRSVFDDDGADFSGRIVTNQSVFDDDILLQPIDSTHIVRLLNAIIGHTADKDLVVGEESPGVDAAPETVVTLRDSVSNITTETVDINETTWRVIEASSKIAEQSKLAAEKSKQDCRALCEHFLAKEIRAEEIRANEKMAVFTPVETSGLLMSIGGGAGIVAAVVVSIFAVAVATQI